VVFETIGALGGIKIDTLEIVGSNQSLLCDVGEDDLIGHIYATAQESVFENIGNAIKDIRARKKVEGVKVEKPKEKYPPEFLEQLKSVVQDYLGDFTERVFQNQLKAQRIKSEDLYEDEIKRFIFALGKAAGMIIGPTKGKDLTNKLLAKLK
jgi:gas vesicle protein